MPILIKRASDCKNDEHQNKKDNARSFGPLTFFVGLICSERTAIKHNSHHHEMHCCAYLYLNCGCFFGFFSRFLVPWHSFALPWFPSCWKFRAVVRVSCEEMQACMLHVTPTGWIKAITVQLNSGIKIEHSNFHCVIDLWNVPLSVQPKQTAATVAIPEVKLQQEQNTKWSSHKWSVWSANLCRKLWFSQDLARRYAASFVVDVSECHRVSDDRTSSHLTREQRKFL